MSKHSQLPLEATKTSQPALMQIQANDLRSDLDLTTEELKAVLSLSEEVKRHPERFYGSLRGRYLALLFEKPSLRTRLTFELAIKQLGGDSVFQEGPVGKREPVKDVARNLERWTHGIVARTFQQETIEELAHWARIPVINALSDLYHPCQALADMLTLKEHLGGFQGIRLAFLGDGNNVAHSLLLTGSRLGLHIAVATPPGYEPNPAIVEQARRFAQDSGGSVIITNQLEEAVPGADAVYTDVWASMGKEQERDIRSRTFEPYRVTPQVMEMAARNAIFMHCLPAKRGEEVVDEVIESNRSVVFDQAENRLHTQKALLLMLLSS